MAQLGAWAIVGALVVGGGTSTPGGADADVPRDGGAPDAPALVDATASDGAVPVRVVSATFDQELLHGADAGARRIRFRVECRQQVAMSPPISDWGREYCQGFTAVLARCGGIFDARVACIGQRCATACQP